MLIGKVATVSEEWYKNVLINGLKDNITYFDYWTNGWIPNPEENEPIDRLEIYYQGNLVMSGRYKGANKLSPQEVYNQWKLNPQTIGLDSNSTYNDFKDILKKCFDTVPIELGNLYFDVDSVNANVDKGLAQRGIVIPSKITRVPEKKSNANSRIVYERS